MVFTIILVVWVKAILSWATSKEACRYYRLSLTSLQETIKQLCCSAIGLLTEPLSYGDKHKTQNQHLVVVAGWLYACSDTKKLLTFLSIGLKELLSFKSVSLGLVKVFNVLHRFSQILLIAYTV